MKDLWELRTKQKVFDICDVRVGGSPGENPTVLIGSIFYEGQKILVDESRGEFDERATEKLVSIHQEFSDKTGNPFMLDIGGSTSQALIKFLDFVADVTDVPLLIDGASSPVRLGALDYIKQSGLSSRVVYNSITPESKPEELEKIKETSLESAVLLAYNVHDFTSRGRVNAVTKLLPAISEAGISKPLLDACVIDIPTLGMACSAIFDLKNELGLPSGCGAHNAIVTWRGLRTKMGPQAKKPSMAAANVLTAAAGSDFILYGPIESASYVFPVIAMVDAAYGQLIIEKGQKLGLNHPIFKIP